MEVLFPVAFWYLLAALTVPSLLQASTTGFLLFAVALIRHRQACIDALRYNRDAWILIVIALLAGVVFSVVPDKSLKGVYDLLRGVLLYPVALALVSEYDSQSVRHAASRFFSILGLLLFLVTAALQAEAGSVFLRDSLLLQAHIGNLHELANLAAVTVLALTCLLATRQASGEIRWVMPVIAAVAAVAVLLATTSRGNWLAVSVCIALVFSLRNKRMLYIWLLVPVAIVFAYIAFLLIHDSNCSGGSCFGQSLLIRKQIIMETWQLFLQAPWFGYGINSFKYVSGLVSEGNALIMPHNVYIELLYSCGVAGSALFCTGMVLLYRRRCSKQSCRPLAAHGGCGFPRLFGLVLFVYLLLRGIVDMKLFSYEYPGLMFLALGLLAAAAHD